ncbi:hypothetical protein K3495_g16950, partial [Podosphaera aphanis]
NESYIQRRGSKTTSTLFNGQSENFNRPSHEAFAASGISSGENRPKLDSDGDVVMSGINGINMETLTAIVNAVKTDSGKGRAGNSKPPAPWRSHEEFNALRASGKCTRCSEKGHYFKKCPRFTWARRPTNINATSSKIARPSNPDNEEFGFESGGDSGKE